MNKLLFFALVFLMGSCSIFKSNGVKINEEITTASGLKYTIISHEKGAKKIDSNDIVTVHYVGTLADSTVFDASYNRNNPIKFEVGVGRVIKGWDEGLIYLHNGDSAILKVPANIAYGDKARKNIPANSDLKFIVKIVNLKKAVKPWKVNLKDRVYLEDSLVYITVSMGHGDTIAQEGNRVALQYSGYYTNWKKFDSSYDNDAKVFEFIIGRHHVIKGWDKGVIGMKIGEKRRLYVPYQLAYGEKGRNPIGPKQDLIFDVELVKIEVLEYPKFDTQGKDTVAMKNGVKYIIAKKTDGRKVKPHSKISMKYVGRFLNGKVFDSSYDRGDSLVFKVAEQRVIKGLDDGLLELRNGEMARFFIPYKLAYGEAGRGELIPEKSDLIFDVVLTNVEEPVVELNPNAPSNDVNEDEERAKFIATNRIKIKPRASGLYFIPRVVGNGKQAVAGKRVKVHYTGTLLNGQKFDSSVDRGKPFEFVLGAGRVIKGWDEGIALMKEGGKATFIIPSKLAYGTRGAGQAIPPNSTIVFEVELIEVME